MEMLERTFGAEPGGRISHTEAEITARYKGRSLEKIWCPWKVRHRVSEQLRKQGFIIYDIK